MIPFQPHRMCLARDSGLISLYFWSDVLIGFAYMAISTMVLYLLIKNVRHRYAVWFVLFAAFIFFCGLIHFAEAYTMYSPVYRQVVVLWPVTAFFSGVTTVGMLVALGWMDKILHIDERAQKLRDGSEHQP